MEVEVKLIRNHRYKNILASRSVPILFIVVCFLVIANTTCDQVGSANASETSDVILIDKNHGLTLTSPRVVETQPASTTAKYDPLNMLREIYLDGSSKVITMIQPQNGDSVQKFHPNGRYGRRSVSNNVEPSSAHSELGKLRFADSAGPLRSLLHNFNNAGNKDNNHHKIETASDRYQFGKQRQQEQPKMSVGDNSELIFGESGTANYESELNKLLKCNYTGMANLYWCDTGRE